MNKIKRVVSVALCVLMMVSMLTVCQLSFAFAASENGYTYTITEDNTATVTGYTGAASQITIPATLGGVSVTAIGDNAFLDNRTLSKIVLPNSVTVVGNSAFQGATALSELTLSTNLQTIGDGAFIDCKALETLVIGSKVTSMGVSVLNGCTALKELTIPYVEGSLAELFAGKYPAGLETVVVTNDDSVDAKAFMGMSSLKTLQWTTAPTSVGISAFEGCTSLNSLSMAFNKIECINARAFYGCKSLEGIVLSNKVTQIGASVFEGCTALVDVVATNKLQSVGKDALKGTAWLNNAPEGVVMLAGVMITYKGNDTTITVPAEVTSIADSAFEGNTTVKEVVIPATVSYIGIDVLKNTKVESLVIPYVGSAAETKDAPAISYLFGGSGHATNATALPATLKKVELTSCQSVGQSCFAGCAYLEEIVIPATVKTIGNEAFASCPSLKTIKYNAENAAIMADSFKGTTATSIVFGDTVKTIPTYLCTANAALTEIDIPVSVTKIDTRAFAGCYNVTTVNYGAANCTSISADAFDYCHKLSNVVLADTVKHIPANLYSRYGGGNIRSLTIPEQITSIAEKAFSNCAALETLYFNAAECNVGSEAFFGCNNLSKIVLGEKVTTIPSNLYAGNTAITKIEVPETITRIDSYAFADCSALTEITVSDNLLSVGQNVLNGSKWYNLQADGPLYLGKICIGYKGTLPADNSITINNGTLAIADGAFKGNGSLTNVFVPNSVSVIGEGAFAQTSASITCYEDATHIIDYANNNGINCITLFCPHTTTYFDIQEEATAESAGKWNEVCLDCGQILAVGVEYAKGEEANEWVLTTAPTCTATGVITKGTETQVIGVTGHQVSIWKETKVATCTAEGESCEFCAACGTKLAGCVSIKKTEHVAGSWTIIRQPRTYCTGINAVMCTGCGDILKSKEIDKLEEHEGVGVLFTDLYSSEWYYKTVEFALNNGFFNGVTAEEFRPNETMNRAMFVTVLGRMAGVEVKNDVNTQFTDVKKNQYYTGYVAWAVGNGIVNGVTSKTFCPNDPITREQICTMILRYADYQQVELTAKKKAELFKDADEISNYAVKAVLACQKAGIVKGRGKGYFAPKSKATRAEVAQILQNLALGYFAD